ncbi:MAG: fused MFS/spermidine synthase, partial [Anaerolineales bacterium]|nr:fused MFS/spermidine synthase [Anaerolineales bacterium]
KYSAIVVDAYRLPYIPWHLTTKEFFLETKSLLRPTGVLAINVGRTNTDRRLVDALSATLLSVFPTVHVIDVPDTFNSILVATNTTTSANNLQHNLSSLDQNVHALLPLMLAKTINDLVPTQPNDMIFTDDRAPVEHLTDSILLNYLLGSATDKNFTTSPEL